MSAASRSRSRIGGFLRRHPWLTGAVLLVLVLRAALPAVLRPLLSSQLSELIHGRVEIGDVDLWLLRGAAAVQNVSVFSAASESEKSEPVLACDELYARIAWPGLWNRSVRLVKVRLESPRLDLTRLKDGDFNLLRLVSTEDDQQTAEGEEQPTGAEDAASWTIAGDRLELKNASIAFRDLEVGSPDVLHVAVSRLQARDLPIVGSVYDRPAHALLEGKIENAPVRIEADLRYGDASVQLQTTVNAEGLDLRRTRLYLAETGWSKLEGLADVSLRYRLETGEHDELSGDVALRDFSIYVPDIQRPVLGWKSLAVKIDSIDLLHRHLDVGAIDLRGADILLLPRGPIPLPLLAWGAADEPGTGSAAAPDEPATTGLQEDETPPWSWKVSQLDVRDSQARVELPDAKPLGVAVRVSATGVSSEAAAFPVEIGLVSDDASFEVRGSTGLQPLGFSGGVQWKDVSLPRMAAAIGLQRALLAGTSSGDLQIAAGMKTPPEMQVSSWPHPDGTVRLGGEVTIDGLDLSGDDPKRFSIQWQSLHVGIREALLPAVLASEPQEAAHAMRVQLVQIDLSSPVVRLTRTTEGLVLPALAGDPSTPKVEGAADESEQRSSVGGENTGDHAVPPLAIEIDKTHIEGGSVTFADEAVDPAFRGALKQIDLDAERFSWPQASLGVLSLQMKAPGNALLTVTEKNEEGGMRFKIDADKIGLRTFNTYTRTYSGYGISRGNASLRSRIRLAEGGFESKNRVTLHGLGVESGNGSDLFVDEFGVPLTLALALMKNVAGDIVLDLPVERSTRGAELDLLNVVGGVLRRSIVNAIASPLKIVGLVRLGDGKIEDFRLQEISFAPGTARPTPAGEQQMQQLAALLVDRPGLGVRFIPHSGSDDLRWLREQNLLEAMQRGVVDVPAGETESGADVEDAIRAYLEARATGGTPELPAEVGRVLSQLLEAQDVPPQSLVDLARERLEAAQSSLHDQHGIEEERLLGVPAAVTPSEGVGGVSIEIVAAS